MSAYIIDLNTLERRYFCSNQKWNEYYVQHKLINYDILYLQGFKMLDAAMKSNKTNITICDHYDNVKPIIKEHEDVNVERAIKGNYMHGLGHVHKFGNIVMTSGFAGAPKDADFSKRLTTLDVHNAEVLLLTELLGSMGTTH